MMKMKKLKMPTKKIEPKENIDYQNNEIKPASKNKMELSQNSNNNENNINNKNKKEEILISDQNSEPILLKDKIQYQENESYNEQINNKIKKEKAVYKRRKEILDIKNQGIVLKQM